MSKKMKVLKEIINSKEIIYPHQHQAYRGLNLHEEDFINFRDLFEICRSETYNKYAHIRDIGNNIIAKEGPIRGIEYTEKGNPELTLLFKEDEYSINEKNVNDLLDSTNFTSDLEYAIAMEYLEELKMFKECLEDGIFYPDINALDYTGSLQIDSHHKYYSSSQDTTLFVPSNFGIVNVYLNNVVPFVKINYVCALDKWWTQSTINNADRLLDRGFVHKALLPDQLQQKLK